MRLANGGAALTEDFLAATRRAKMVRKKNPRAIGKHHSPARKQRPKGQVVLYQAMLTKKDKALLRVEKQQRDAEERYTRRMREIKEAQDE